MNNPVNLTNHFLIAMPALMDPNFYHTVTYICEHNEEGAMGIIINRPAGLVLGEVLDQIDIKAATESLVEQPIYVGGPVQPDRGFVIHPPGTIWESTLQINDQLNVTTSKDILSAIAEGKGPENTLVALGYAGWEAGQLEQEMADNTWLSGPAAPDIIFHHSANKRWEAAAKLLGVDLNLISSDAGHA